MEKDRQMQGMVLREGSAIIVTFIPYICFCDIEMTKTVRSDLLSD